MISSLLYNENPGHDDRGFLSLQHFAMQGNASSPLGDKSMRAQYVPTPSKVATNTDKLTINCRMT
jgi:hypothetical protein